jgi:hypothetical protein
VACGDLRGALSDNAAKTQAPELEARIKELAQALAEVRTRVEALEQRARWFSRPHEIEPPQQTRAGRGGADATSVSTLLGRTLVALGGAYLLRIATDVRELPGSLSVAAGLSYAGCFLVLADRAARRRRSASALFHTIAAVAIAYPLLWETTVRFGLLQPRQAGALLIAALAGGWAVALRRDLPVVAAAFTFATLVTSLGLLLTVRDFLAFAPACLALAGTAEVVSLDGRWSGFRWPAALGIDLAAWALIEVVARPGGMPEEWTPISPGYAAALLLLLPLLYVPSVIHRIVRGHEPSGFDVVQTPIVLLLGLGGGSQVLESAGHSPLAVTLAATVLGATAYATLLLRLAKREHAAPLFVAAVALVLVLFGTSRAPLAAERALASSFLGLGTAFVSERVKKAHLEIHTCVYVAAAAIASGLVGGIGAALVGPLPHGGSVFPGATAAVVVAAALGCYFVLGRGEVGLLRRVGRQLIGVLACLTAASLGVRLLILGGWSTTVSLAVLRTWVLAGLAAALAASSRLRGFQDLSWLALAVLVLGGFKLVIEDVPSGRPATLFLALTAYGGALVVTPRLLRR